MDNFDNPDYELAGNAISQFVKMRVKLFCLEAAQGQTNIEFDECHQRLSFLNFKYFNDIMTHARHK